MYMDPAKVAEILMKYEGQIITVSFIKRTNGELRVLNGRVGVKKYVKGAAGKGPSYDPKAHNLFTIFDMQVAARLPEEQRAKAYRSIGLESVLEIHAGGLVYKA
jgi:hypothetical protein